MSIRLNNLYIIIFFLSISAFHSCKKSDQKPDQRGGPGKPQLKVEGFIVGNKLLTEELSVSGTLMPFDEVELKPEISGRVVKLYLPEGKFVKAGTLLVKLYDEDLQASLKKLNSQLALQEKIYQRQSELMKVNGISQNEYDQTGLQVNSLKADIEYQKAIIRKTEVLSPFDGIIGLRNISTGALVNTSTVLSTFRSNNRLKLDFSIPEKYSPEIITGMIVSFKLNNDEKLYKANIIATETGIDKNTRNLRIRALVNDSSVKLVSGSFANVNLKLRENKNAILVPTRAIIPIARKKSVIIAKDGMAIMKEVKTGVRKSFEIEVIEGLSAGDTIVTSGLLFLKEGMPVIFSTVKKDTI
jgi:membrane fusion protein, multidrug efflux system